MRKDSTLLVELFGQPGAGKTTLARAVAGNSAIRGKAGLNAAWKQQSKFDKARLVARAFLDAACLAHARRLVTGARLYRSDCLSRLARLMIKSHWVRSQTEPLLLEEGHLQDLWSIFYSAGEMEPDPGLLAPLIRCLYRGVDAQIVFLDVEPNEAFNRVRSRTHGKSRFDRLTDEELRRQSMASARLPQRLADAASLAGLRVKRLDASLSIETNVDLMRDVMRSYDETSTGRPERMA